MAKNYQELEENIKARERLLKLGVCSMVIGPRGLKGEKGDKGDKGDAGSIAVSSYEGLFFTGFVDTSASMEMEFDNTWLIPEPAEYFLLPNENEVEVMAGIYEITFSGLISEADDTHGAVLYLSSSDGAAIKDLSFSLNPGNGKQMYFSQTTILRFEEDTVLQAMVNIIGDIGTSSVVISDVNLLIKKIHTNN